MQNEYSLIELLGFLNKWRKAILWTTLAAFVLSLIISLLLPVYYKASTVFFAASEDLSAPAPVGGFNRKEYIYGTDDDRDRLLSIAQSNAVKSHLVSTFDLYDVYDIDSNNYRGPHEMMEQLDKLFDIKKSPHGGIEITVEDTDPQRAADMANSARDKVSDLVQSMIKDSQKKLMDGYQEKIVERSQSIASVDDSLKTIRKRYNIFDSGEQGNAFAELLAETNASITEFQGKIQSAKEVGVPRDTIRKWTAQLAGFTSKKSQLLQDASEYNEGIIAIRQMEVQLSRSIDQLSVDRERYNQLLATYKAPFTAIHTVEPAYKPVYKSRPKKAIVVLGATIAAFLLSMLGVMVIELYRRIPWSKIQNAG